jgi:hypothetical protein
MLIIPSQILQFHILILSSITVRKQKYIVQQSIDSITEINTAQTELAISITLQNKINITEYSLLIILLNIQNYSCNLTSSG